MVSAVQPANRHTTEHIKSGLLQVLQVMQLMPADIGNRSNAFFSEKNPLTTPTIRPDKQAKQP